MGRGSRGVLSPPTVEFDADQWALIERAAARAGLSPGEYVRELALAHAATITDSPNGEQEPPRQARVISDRWSEHRALIAEAKQAVHHTRELMRQFHPEDDLGNIAYVRRLWEAFASGGVGAMAALVPDDAVWRPTKAEGRALHGTRDLQEFWASHEIVMPALRMFHGHRDDVLVEAEFPQDDGSIRTVWLLYRFDGERLIEAISFPDEAQARSYS